MRLARYAGTVIVGAFGLQAALAQDYTGVSMMVTDINGQAAGSLCEPFDCTPHVLPLGAGTVLMNEIYGLADQPYILFAGPPAAQCLTLPWVMGAVAMDFPITIVDVGLVPASGLPNKCGLDTAINKIEIPAVVPAGAQLVLQTAAWSALVESPGFSRAVMLTIV